MTPEEILQKNWTGSKRFKAAYPDVYKWIIEAMKEYAEQEVKVPRMHVSEPAPERDWFRSCGEEY